MLIPLGTNEGLMSYPDEQIGYLASDQYSSRIATPSQGGGYLQKLHSNSSQPAIESPLRKTSFPADDLERSEFDRTKGSVSGKSDAIDSEAEEDVIHVDDPARRYNKVTGGEETINEVEDLGPNGGNTPDHGGYIDENGYGVPILASDEVAKDIGAEHLQPAVSPNQERRSSLYYIGDEYGSGNITPTSRPTSRPASIHGVSASLSRFVSRHDDREEMHTPLEDVEEYEPLFPEDDENKKRPISTADRFKQRPDTLKHRFPSQDIWEDTPSSAMHVTTVSTPDLLAQNESTGTKGTAKTFEDPEEESARKGEVDEAEKSKLVPNEERLARSRFAPHLRDDMPTRPGMQQRFPSRDIWEDSPDSMQLVTTVASPPPVGEDPKSPEEAAASKPSIPPRPLNRSKLGESSTTPSVPVSTEVKQPQIPARPPKRIHAVPPGDAKLTDFKIAPQTMDKNISPTEVKKGPSIPDRPKPQLPARPAKKESLEALTKTISGGSSGSQDTVTSPPLPKAKPTIPARPGGNKGNLPTAFMSDLNQRLQLGPRHPVKEKEPEPAADKGALPLSDARKGRARGPQRRAPAKSPSGSAEIAQMSLPKFCISTPQLLWSINEDDGLSVNTHEEAPIQPQKHVPKVLAEDTDSKAAAAASARPTDAPQPMAPIGLAMNTAGESTDPSPMGSATATPGTEKSDPLSKSIGSLVRESREGFSSLSKQTTASSGDASGAPLEPVEHKNEEAGKLSTGQGGASGAEHGTPSKATTASSAASSEPLKNVPIQEPRTAVDEKVSENVLAADAETEPTPQKEVPVTSVKTGSRVENDDTETDHVGTGHGEMRTESGIKTNIADKQLEEMTAIADGKDHASEEEDSANSSRQASGQVGEAV
jgi:Altered inheritance of mitochondria protein 21